PPLPYTLSLHDASDLMICGEDPYAWKGKEEILVPFLRPENPEQAAQIFGELFKLNNGDT
ncbi:MAG: hypothetical protein AAFY34_13390, partial [Pseudomonadota bacterium]